MPRVFVPQHVATLAFLFAAATAPAFAADANASVNPAAARSAAADSAQSFASAQAAPISQAPLAAGAPALQNAQPSGAQPSGAQAPAAVGADPADEPLQPVKVLNPVKDYARVLRVINPHLPDWQRRKYAASVLANAQRTHIDPRFIMAIVTVESSWRSNAVSHSGARGLGQLMPSTAARLDVNARDAAQNLRGTATYLRSLLDRFRGQEHWFEKAIAGYNAGPNAVKKYGGIPPYAETQHYVVKVLRVYTQLYGRLAIAWTPYTSHRYAGAARVAADESAALTGAPPTLALDAFQFAPIPVFKSSF